MPVEFDCSLDLLTDATTSEPLRHCSQLYFAPSDKTADFSSIQPTLGSVSPPTIGTILAQRYAIESLLGRGDFSMTFLARNLNLPGQPACVIKQLALQSSDAREIATSQRRFYLEAQTLSMLGSHAQIPTLLDYFQMTADLYLVEEYIPGMVLSRSLDRANLIPAERQTRYSELKIEDFLRQMLRLLEYIHGHRLIHRDIKPQNIILCQTDRRYVLVDFGAVKDLNPRPISAPDRADISRSIGTPGFAPPEQLANRAVYASDIYALGMTCIFLLTGKDPTQLPTDPYTCELVWADRVEISDSLSDILGKMVQVSLTDRYHSASEVLNALDNRSVRATLKVYLDQKYAIAKTESLAARSGYPAAIDWALGI